MENSLKRFLKRKIKITLGLIVSFMISGTILLGAEELAGGSYNASYIKGEQIATGDLTINGQITNGNLNLNGCSLELKDDTEKSKGIHNSIVTEGKEIKILTTNTDSFGISAEAGNKTFVTSDIIEINAKHTGIHSTSNANSEVNVTANKLIVNAQHGIVSQNGGRVILTGKDENAILEAKNTGYGIHMKGASAGKIDISKFKTVTLAGGTAGIAIEKPLSIKQYNSGTVNVEADEIAVSGSTGISITGEKSNDDVSTVNLQGNKVTVKTTSSSIYSNAIKISRGGIVNINTEKDYGTVIMNGNMSFSGRVDLDATANINFKTEDSEFNGKITTGKSNASSNIEFSNGATWNNTGNSNVTNLTFNGGVINNTGKTKDNFNDITVDELKGIGGTINMGAEVKDGKADSGEITIGKVDENVKFNINYSGESEADSSKAEDYFKDLAENIHVGEGKVEADVKLEESFVSGEYTANVTVDKDNINVENVKIGNLNTMVEGIRDLATINLLTWRQEMSSLNQRMGELRNGQGEHGVWARVYAGKIENGSQYDNDYQTYQVGFDKKYSVDNGAVFVGGLVSYSKGETNYSHGEGENYSVGLGAYATWLNNDGQFADVVLKQSRLHNKFDVKSRSTDLSQHGDYNNWGTSLSGQYGKRFDINDKFFIEPSTQLTLGRVEDTTYSTSAGVDVHQDTMYSLIGNVGTSVGYKFSEKGNVYLRAALVKEFQGDIDTEYSKDDVTERTSEDLGDTWAEFGVGVNYRFVENANVYLDLERTGDSTVDTKWQANLGFRYEF